VVAPAPSSAAESRVRAVSHASSPRPGRSRPGAEVNRTFRDIADAEARTHYVPAEELDKLTAAHLEAVAADVAAAVGLEKVCEARGGDASELAAEQVSEHRAQALELLAEVSAELVKLANARAMGANARDNNPKGRTMTAGAAAPRNVPGGQLGSAGTRPASAERLNAKGPRFPGPLAS
jgi:hypothetical protein